MLFTWSSRLPGPKLTPVTTTASVDVISWQTNPWALEIVSTQVWLWEHGFWDSVQTLVYWQRWPVNPERHSQVNDPSVLVQVPPNWHGSRWGGRRESEGGVMRESERGREREEESNGIQLAQLYTHHLHIHWCRSHSWLRCSQCYKCRRNHQVFQFQGCTPHHSGMEKVSRQTPHRGQYRWPLLSRCSYQ